jgi:hypothetical protein
MKKNWIAGLYVVAIAIALLTALAVFHADSAKGHGGSGGGGSAVSLSSREPFIIVIEPGFPIHLQDPQYVTDRAFGNILRADEFAHIMRQNWIDAFINRGSNEHDRHHRHDLIERQLGYEQGQFHAWGEGVFVNSLYYSSVGTDFVMDWGTAIAQDVTGEPLSECYDWSKWGTGVVMLEASEAFDWDVQDEYRKQAVDQTIEVFSDFAIGSVHDSIKTVRCNASETLTELATSTGIKSMVDRAVERSDKKPGLGWAPTRAR